MFEGLINSAPAGQGATPGLRPLDWGELVARLAAARDETLYGMLAAEQLGMKIPETHADADFTPNDWAGLRDTPAVRAADSSASTDS